MNYKMKNNTVLHFLKFLFDVRKIDFVHIKQYLERNGWTLIMFNTPSGDTLIKKLNLEDYTTRADGFVYDVGCLKYVFINNHLSERDKLITLLHEVGHIELKQDLTVQDNKANELDAWSFASNLYNFNAFCKSQLIVIGINLLITVSALSGAVFAIKGI